MRKIPWRRKWQTTPIFLPGKSCGQRSLIGYKPLGCKTAKYNLVTKKNKYNISSRLHLIGILLVIAFSVIHKAVLVLLKFS